MSQLGSPGAAGAAAASAAAAPPAQPPAPPPRSLLDILDDSALAALLERVAQLPLGTEEDLRVDSAPALTASRATTAQLYSAEHSARTLMAPWRTAYELASTSPAAHGPLSSTTAHPQQQQQQQQRQAHASSSSSSARSAAASRLSSSSPVRSSAAGAPAGGRAPTPPPPVSVAAALSSPLQCAWPLHELLALRATCRRMRDAVARCVRVVDLSARAREPQDWRATLRALAAALPAMSELRLASPSAPRGMLARVVPELHVVLKPVMSNIQVLALDGCDALAERTAAFAFLEFVPELRVLSVTNIGAISEPMLLGLMHQLARHSAKLESIAMPLSCVKDTQVSPASPAAQRDIWRRACKSVAVACPRLDSVCALSSPSFVNGHVWRLIDLVRALPRVVELVSNVYLTRDDPEFDQHADLSRGSVEALWEALCEQHIDHLRVLDLSLCVSKRVLSGIGSRADVLPPPVHVGGVRTLTSAMYLDYLMGVDPAAAGAARKEEPHSEPHPLPATAEAIFNEPRASSVSRNTHSMPAAAVASLGAADDDAVPLSVVRVDVEVASAGTGDGAPAVRVSVEPSAELAMAVAAAAAAARASAASSDSSLVLPDPLTEGARRHLLHAESVESVDAMVQPVPTLAALEVMRLPNDVCFELQSVVDRAFMPNLRELWTVESASLKTLVSRTLLPEAAVEPVASTPSESSLQVLRVYPRTVFVSAIEREEWLARLSEDFHVCRRLVRIDLPEIPNDLARAVAKYAPRLRTMMVQNDMPQLCLTEESLLAIARGCPRLRHLDVAAYNAAVTVDVLRAFIEPCFHERLLHFHVPLRRRNHTEQIHEAMRLLADKPYIDLLDLQASLRQRLRAGTARRAAFSDEEVDLMLVAEEEAAARAKQVADNAAADKAQQEAGCCSGRCTLL